MEYTFQELLTPWILKAVQGQLPMKNLHVENDVFASHLQVDTINGIDITNLMDSSFVRGSSKKIEGIKYYIARYIRYILAKNNNISSHRRSLF